MNPLSLLLILFGGAIEVLGVLYCVVFSGDGGINMPLLIGIIVFGSFFTFGGVAWHILQRRV